MKVLSVLHVEIPLGEPCVCCVLEVYQIHPMKITLMGSLVQIKLQESKRLQVNRLINPGI